MGCHIINKLGCVFIDKICFLGRDVEFSVLDVEESLVHGELGLVCIAVDHATIRLNGCTVGR